ELPPPPPPPPPPPLTPLVSHVEWARQSRQSYYHAGPLSGGTRNAALLGNDQAYDITVDAWGNAYTTGAVRLTVGEQRPYKMFVQKVNAGGSVRWTLISDGDAVETGQGISMLGFNASERPGILYVTGYFNSANATFGDKVLQSTSDEVDVFVLKLTDSGSVLWARSLGGDLDDVGYGVDVSEVTGDVFVTGYFKSATATMGEFTVINADKSVNVNKSTSDVFVAQVDANGTVKQLASWGGVSADVGHSIAADASGRVYVAGEYSSLNASFGEQHVLRSTEGDHDGYMEQDPVSGEWSERTDTDMFLAQVGVGDGEVQWVLQAGGLKQEAAESVCIDRQQGARSADSGVFVTGRYDSVRNATFGDSQRAALGRMDVFLLKVSYLGTVVWDFVAGGPGNDVGRSVTVDNLGDAYVGGYFTGSATFSRAPTVRDGQALSSAPYVLTSPTEDDSDLFVMKVWKTGSLDFVLGGGGTGTDRGYGIAATGASSGAHSLYVTGFFENQQGISTFGRYNMSTWANVTSRRYAYTTMNTTYLPDAGFGTEDTITMKILPKQTPPPPPPPPSPPPRPPLRHHHLPLLLPVPASCLLRGIISVHVVLQFDSSEVLPIDFTDQVARTMVSIYTSANGIFTKDNVTLLSITEADPITELKMEAVLPTASDSSGYAAASEERLVEAFLANDYYANMEVAVVKITAFSDRGYTEISETSPGVDNDEEDDLFGTGSTAIDVVLICIFAAVTVFAIALGVHLSRKHAETVKQMLLEAGSKQVHPELPPPETMPMLDNKEANVEQGLKEYADPKPVEGNGIQGDGSEDSADGKLQEAASDKSVDDTIVT
ncbi:hypothetical protein CYMTET_28008, partial [Cymbomonas tetramitiformis]